MTAYRGDRAQRQPTDDGDPDLYPTPPWAARAGGELVRRLDPQARTCWEPTCGLGHMAYGLQDYFEAVGASDLHPYGFGPTLDFLTSLGSAEGERLAAEPWDIIMANPPFHSAAAFVATALARARRGTAMLLRLQFLCAQSRHELLYGRHPVTVVAPFAERVAMVKGRWDPAASTATDYAWFVWIKGVPPGPRLEPIPPGTRARLTRPDDAARFGMGRAA